jgi:hypothetical protein
MAFLLLFCNMKNMGAATTGRMMATVPNAHRQLLSWKRSAILGPAKVVMMYGDEV